MLAGAELGSQQTAEAHSETTEDWDPPVVLSDGFLLPSCHSNSRWVPASKLLSLVSGRAPVCALRHAKTSHTLRVQSFVAVQWLSESVLPVVSLLSIHVFVLTVRVTLQGTGHPSVTAGYPRTMFGMIVFILDLEEKRVWWPGICTVSLSAVKACSSACEASGRCVQHTRPACECGRKCHCPASSPRACM